MDKIKSEAKEWVRGADVSIVTSYCPDAINACGILNCSSGLKVFYDLDTPVTRSISRMAMAFLHTSKRIRVSLIWC